MADAASPPGSRIPIAWLIAGALVLALVIWRAWAGGQPPLVETMIVQPQKAVQALAVVGRVRPVELVDIRAEFPGKASKLFVDEGARVRRGEALAIVESAEQAAQAAAAGAEVRAREAALDEARQNLNRVKPLAEKGIASGAALDTAETRVRTAQAQLNAARASANASNVRVRRFTITAPMAGIVLTRPVDAGQVVDTQTTLFQIGSEGRIEVEAEVDEIYADTLQAGMRALIKPSGAAETIAAEVKEVAPRIDPRTGGRVVRLDVSGDVALTPGRTVDVNIIVAERDNVLVVPRTALNVDGAVRVIENGRVVEKPVRVLAWPSPEAIVLSGLESGAVVLNDPRAAETGARVTAKAREK